MEPILGTIAYLDEQEVNNLLASLEGGLIQQLTERTADSTTKEAGTGAGVPGVVKVSGDVGSMREQAREAIKQPTAVSRLTALRQILIDNDYVQYVNVTSRDLREALEEDALLEIQGGVTTSAFGNFINMAANVQSILETYGGLFGQDVSLPADVTQMLRYFADITQRCIPVNVDVPPETEHDKGFGFSSILDPESLRVKSERLNRRYTLLGRVEKIMGKSETIYPYELIPGGATIMRRKQMRALIGTLNKNAGKQLGMQFSDRDMMFKYPTVLIAPIAMYTS